MSDVSLIGVRGGPAGFVVCLFGGSMFCGELFHRIALRFVRGAAKPFSGGDILIGTNSVRGVTGPGTTPLSGEMVKAGDAKTQSRRSWGKEYLRTLIGGVGWV